MDPAILFGSKISALDPRKVLENLGSWLLDPYNVRLENFKSELFQTWDSQVTETGVKPKKTKHELQTKTLSKKFWIALSRFCCNAHPHHLRVAAVGSARYCIL